MEWFIGLETEYKVTLIGVLVTAVMSGFSLYFSIRNNKAVHYVNSITKSRIEWIQKLRTVVAEFIAKTNVYNNVYYKGDWWKMGEQLSECQKLNSEIKLLLNCCDKRDKRICSLVDNILEKHRKYCDEVQNMDTDSYGYFIESNDIRGIKYDIEREIASLIKEVHIYLKSEWNRVKYESKGKEYYEEVLQFDLDELKSQYDNNNYKKKTWKRRYIVIYSIGRRKFPFSLIVGAIIWLRNRIHRAKR